MTESAPREVTHNPHMSNLMRCKTNPGNMDLIRSKIS